MTTLAIIAAIWVICAVLVWSAMAIARRKQLKASVGLTGWQNIFWKVETKEASAKQIREAYDFESKPPDAHTWSE